MDVLADGVEPNDLASRELGEHRSQAMEVILCPFVEWMVVTVGALHPASHENLGDEFRLQSWILNQSEKGCRTILGRVASSGNYFSGHLVVARANTPIAWRANRERPVPLQESW